MIGMAEIKSYTDIEQSKKLAEFLPHESADMCWTKYIDNGDITSLHATVNYGIVLVDYPCWSLAALLKILGFIELTTDKISEDKSACMVSTYIDGRRYDSMFHDHAVDACYTLILKLHELNLL